VRTTKHAREDGRSVCFSPLADRIDSLARAEREGRLRERIGFLCRSSGLAPQCAVRSAWRERPEREGETGRRAALHVRVS
jgi:hypothetical protein